MSGILVYVTFPGPARQALQERARGAVDGQIIDRYGPHWLIGCEQG